MKACFKCGEVKRLNQFYKHPQMPDGHVNKCKECNKKDVSENYRKNIAHYVEYEKRRFQSPERKHMITVYQQTGRAKNPEKDHARSMVTNAVRDHRLTKQPCAMCGSARSEAHHTDYSKPLDVTWLCRPHHLAEHGKVSHNSALLCPQLSI